MNRKVILTLVAALMIAGSAFASDEQAVATEAMDANQDSSVAMEALDTNQDNFISQEEAGAVKGLVELFAQVDANQDGQLDTAEYEQALKTQVEEHN